MGAVATPLLGRLGGGRKRRPVILGGLVLVTAGTVLSALPLGFPALLGGRILQGVGLGLTPLAIAAAREAVASARLGRVVALLSVTTVAGAGFGYPVTGVVADQWGIRGAFWFGFVLCLVTTAMAWRFVPHATSTDAGRVDWLGAVLLASGTTAVLLALSQGPEWGWGVAGLVAVGGAVVLAAWTRWTLRSEYPLVDLHLVRRGGTVAANFTAVAAGMGMYMSLTLVVVLVQDDQWGLAGSVTTAGLLLVPYALFSVLGSRFALFAGRHAPDLVLPLGCSLYVASGLYLAVAHTTLWQVLVAMAVAGLGSGCTFSALPGLIVRHVPAHETGSALAFNQVLRYLGFSVGTTLSVTILGLLADASGPTETGFTVAILVAAGVMAGAALVNLLLTRRPTGAAPG